MGRRRVPQITDTVCIELRLPPQTEEWAEDLLADDCDTIKRTDDALVITAEVGGNTSGLSCVRSWLQDVEDALNEGEIEPMEMDIRVRARPA